MPAYSAYGINFISEIPLPGLPLAAGEPAAEVRRGSIPYLSPALPDAARHFQKAGDGVLLAWSGYGRFLVRGGCEIMVEPVPGAEESVLRHLILGPVFSVLNFQRGLAIFHASAVALGVGGVGFMGRKGYGKSTQAAAFVRRGCPLITDDLLLLSPAGSTLQALPGVPFLKLWPESLDMMGEDPGGLPLVKANLEKRTLSMPQAAVTEPVTMRAVIVLDSGPEVELLPLKKQEAMRSIMPHWYGALFDGELLPVLGYERYLRDCAMAVERLPVFRLKRPADMSHLPEICDRISEAVA